MPWRGPEHPDDFPSLGWALLDWWAEYLPSPRDAASPLLFTDEQALQLVEWFRIDPRSGKYIYRRGYSRRSKGWGKSPVEAAKAIAEFAGPVRFDGWNANGEPVARPWGLNHDPKAWVQIGAISEDQTDNTWSVVHYLLTENDGRAADELKIDPGLTRCLKRDQPGSKMEPVTASAGSREGQPVTYTVLDESHLMRRANGGVKLAAVLRRNVAKMGGRSYETTNSFVIGSGSVAEMSFNDVRDGALGIFADEVEAPREIDGTTVDRDASDAVLLGALSVAYGDSWWVDTHRLVADVRDPSMTWDDACQFFFNWNVASGEGWSTIPKAAWLERVGRPASLTDGRASLSVAPGQSAASLGFAARRDDGSLQVELVRHELGTAWVVEACAKAQAETGLPVIVDPKTPTSGVIPHLLAAGIKVEEISTADLVSACAVFQNEVMHGGVVHLGGADLTDAVRLAEVRTVGESWVFSGRHSVADITPVLAVVLACWGARSGAVLTAVEPFFFV